MKRRICYLDIAKGIGILLMIIAHIPEAPVVCREFITSFHMPLFFIISGMLIKATNEEEREYKDIIARKFTGLMIPYFFFSGISLVLEFLFLIVFHRGSFGELGRQLFVTVCLAGNSVFWFLPALFFGEIIFLKLWKSVDGDKKKIVRGISLFAVAILSYIAFEGEKLLGAKLSEVVWYSYVHTLLATVIRFFFAAVLVGIGWYLFEPAEKMVGRARWTTAGMILCLGVTFAFSRITCGMDMNFMVFHYMLMDVCTAVLGTAGILLLSILLEQIQTSLFVRGILFYGKHSLFVMISHIPFYVMYVAVKITEQIEKWKTLGLIADSLIIFILVLLIEAVMIVVFNWLKEKSAAKIKKEKGAAKQ